MGIEKKPPNPELKTLASQVIRLSKLLTREREGLPAAYLKDEGLRKAYLLYYLPVNQSKIGKPLQELSSHPRNLFEKEMLRVLDIGAGPATASLGALRFFSGQERKPRLAFTAVDPVRENLKEAESLFASLRSEMGVDASLTTIPADIESMHRHVRGRYDLIILSNVLNELFAHEEKKIERRAGVLNQILRTFLDDDGSCVIIEPALRETSRELLAVRDELIEQG
ncbi:MAG TPA: methyltransferase domain-containing protein, partial [Nitrospirota bacterium]